MEDLREKFLKIAIELDERKPFPKEAFNFFFRNPKGYDDNNDYPSNIYDKYNRYERFDELDDYDSSISSDNDDIYDTDLNNNQYENQSESESENEY